MSQIVNVKAQLQSFFFFDAYDPSNNRELIVGFSVWQQQRSRKKNIAPFINLTLNKKVQKFFSQFSVYFFY